MRLESIKVAGALLSYFSILPSSSFTDQNAFVRFAIQVDLKLKPVAIDRIVFPLSIPRIFMFESSYVLLNYSVRSVAYRMLIRH